MVKGLVSAVVLFFVTSQGWAFDGEHARKLLDELASDSYQGRQSGHSGAENAEYLLAQQLCRYGVYWGGNESYFQEFPLLFFLRCLLR